MKPEAKKVRRRRCALPSCNQLYRPVKGNQRFCSIEHKHEYHFKSETFSRVKREVLALIDREVRIRFKPFEEVLLALDRRYSALRQELDALKKPICTECLHHGPQRPEATHSNPDCRYAAARPDSLGPCIKCGNPSARRCYAPAPVAEWGGLSQADLCARCFSL